MTLLAQGIVTGADTPEGSAPKAPSAASARQATWEPGKTRFCINYAQSPEITELQSYDLCILAADARVDLQGLRSMNCEALAYASLVEVRPGTREAEAAARLGIPTVATNEAWGSSILDITHPAWLRWVTEELARPAWTRGFDGLFLDTLDSVERIIKIHPGRKAACHAALVTAIKKLREAAPGKKLLLNRGFALLDEVAADADGLLIESVYQTWSGAEKQYRAVTSSDSRWLLDHAIEAKRRGLPVLVVDYVAPEEAALAVRTAERLEAADCIPFISTPELQGFAHTPPVKKRWVLHESTCQ